jgi:hypothetical protein
MSGNFRPHGNNREIPSRAGLITIDTEGFELEVIRGLGIGSTGIGRLEDMVSEMRKLGYRFCIVIYHVDSAPVCYFCNRSKTVSNSWGNAIPFTDHSLFLRPHDWCETALATTFLR